MILPSALPLALLLALIAPSSALPVPPPPTPHIIDFSQIAQHHHLRQRNLLALRATESLPSTFPRRALDLVPVASPLVVRRRERRSSSDPTDNFEDGSSWKEDSPTYEPQAAINDSDSAVATTSSPSSSSSFASLEKRALSMQKNLAQAAQALPPPALMRHAQPVTQYTHSHDTQSDEDSSSGSGDEDDTQWDESGTGEDGDEEDSDDYDGQDEDDDSQGGSIYGSSKGQDAYGDDEEQDDSPKKWYNDPSYASATHPTGKASAGQGSFSGAAQQSTGAEYQQSSSPSSSGSHNYQQAEAPKEYDNAAQSGSSASGSKSSASTASGTSAWSSTQNSGEAQKQIVPPTGQQYTTSSGSNSAPVSWSAPPSAPVDSWSAPASAALASGATTYASDCAILAHLYTSLGAAYWHNNAGWSSSSEGNCCSAYGVNCDGLGRVSALDLGSNGLSGPLDETVFLLSSLVRLNLSSNALTGNIPDRFALTPRLTTLHLGSNLFTGPIPPSLMLAPSLETVRLSNNSLSSPLSALGGVAGVNFAQATNLTNLFLDRNALSGSFSISSNPALQRVDVDFNNLNGSVPALGPAMLQFSAEGNAFTGSLDSTQLGSARNLQSLDLSSNQLSGNWPTLEALDHLTSVSLVSNAFKGAFPVTPAPAELTTCKVDTLTASECPAQGALQDQDSLAFKCQVQCRGGGAPRGVGTQMQDQATAQAVVSAGAVRSASRVWVALVFVAAAGLVLA